MDTLRDKNYLEQLWSSGNAPWKSWWWKRRISTLFFGEAKKSF
jgi:hypothetical protein